MKFRNRHTEPAPVKKTTKSFYMVSMAGYELKELKSLAKAAGVDLRGVFKYWAVSYVKARLVAEAEILRKTGMRSRELALVGSDDRYLRN